MAIGSFVTFRGFPYKFSKCCFHRCIYSSWLVAFSLALAVLFLLLTSFMSAMLSKIVYLQPSLQSYWSDFLKIYHRHHRRQHGGRKGGRTQGRVNGMPNQMLVGRIPWEYDQDQIVRPGNYCCSSIREASMDDNKTQPSKD